jgi:hypothetical protein
LQLLGVELITQSDVKDAGDNCIDPVLSCFLGFAPDCKQIGVRPRESIARRSPNSNARC